MMLIVLFKMCNIILIIISLCCLVTYHFYFISRAQSDLSQNHSYPNDITYSNNSLQENHSSNSSAQCSENPVLVSQTKKHQTTQQVKIYIKFGFYLCVLKYTNISLWMQIYFYNVNNFYFRLLLWLKLYEKFIIWFRMAIH